MRVKRRVKGTHLPEIIRERCQRKWTAVKWLGKRLSYNWYRGGTLGSQAKRATKRIEGPYIIIKQRAIIRCWSLEKHPCCVSHPHQLHSQRRTLCTQFTMYHLSILGTNLLDLLSLPSSIIINSKFRSLIIFKSRPSLLCRQHTKMRFHLLALGCQQDLRSCARRIL